MYICVCVQLSTQSIGEVNQMAIEAFGAFCHCVCEAVLEAQLCILYVTTLEA